MESEQLENPQMETDINMLEIMQKYPDLLPINNDVLTQHDEDLVSVKTLSDELKLLSLINEVKAIDDQNLEISLRDFDDKPLENDPENVDANDQTSDDFEIFDDNEENIDIIDNTDKKMMEPLKLLVIMKL